jgi:hemoglobin
LAVHAALSGIEPLMFERWLTFFDETAGEVFEPALAAAFRLKARRIAESLQLGLFYRPALRQASAREA